MKTVSPILVRQLFLLLLVVTMGSLIFKEMIPYFSGVLGAITLYVILQGLMKKLVDSGWRANIAALILLFFSFIGILIPIVGILLLMANKISKVGRNTERFIEMSKEALGKLEFLLGLDLTSQFDISDLSTWIANNIQGVAGGTINALISIGLMYIMLYYMLINRTKIIEALIEFIPMNKDSLKGIGIDVQTMVRANALGIPLVAFSQGIIAVIGFMIFDVSNPVFWGVIVFIGSMIPFLGAGLGVFPVFILMLSIGNSFSAWGILLYSILIIGPTDNLMRLYIVNKLDKVHPLITLIGVIIGLPLFGFVGLIFGPLLVSLFLIILKIYKKEYDVIK